MKNASKTGEHENYKSKSGRHTKTALPGESEGNGEKIAEKNMAMAGFCPRQHFKWAENTMEVHSCHPEGKKMPINGQSPINR